MSEEPAKPEVRPWKLAGLAYVLLGLVLSLGCFIWSWSVASTVAVYAWIGLIGGGCPIIDSMIRANASPWKASGIAYVLLGLTLFTGWLIGSWDIGLMVAAYVWIGLIWAACLLIEFLLRTPAGAQHGDSRRVLRRILTAGLVLIGLFGLLAFSWLIMFARGIEALGKVHM